MIRLIGYTLLGLSTFSFLLILVIPWLGYSKGQIAGLITGLVIFGEVTFYLSIFILGKSFWEKIKAMFRFRKQKAAVADQPEIFNDNLAAGKSKD